MTATLADIAAYLDAQLALAMTPDYAPALNGVQVGHRGPVTRIAAAVDASQRTIAMAAAAQANLLLVHHGLFWGGLRPLTGPHETRIRTLFAEDIAVYSAHLPLDAHETFGNSALLARALDLRVSGGFAKYQHIHCGVRGESDLDTTTLVTRVRDWAAPLGHHTVASAIPEGHRTRRWAICSGSGAQVDTLREAYATGVDTLIVGEGPHWSAVEAEEYGLVIVYAGHYATETLGVRALAAHLGERFGLPWEFLHAPTGL
ncbi:MAG TPA: Nif3-like dinuclear metal center hexameric protein [Gemmatimonadaceae bacterium]|nr:Nif3-like dinuclear metal center hexameric protein [Gemmatimonadaceae bacterium]HRQ77016.1 Nif3-like dinuclear metal center hexameric protein [Gemmatimonadaceae bacterium]